VYLQVKNYKSRAHNFEKLISMGRSVHSYAAGHTVHTEEDDVQVTAYSAYSVAAYIHVLRTF